MIKTIFNHCIYQLSTSDNRNLFYLLIIGIIIYNTYIQRFIQNGVDVDSQQKFSTGTIFIHFIIMTSIEKSYEYNKNLYILL